MRSTHKHNGAMTVPEVSVVPFPHEMTNAARCTWIVLVCLTRASKLCSRQLASDLLGLVTDKLQTVCLCSLTSEMARQVRLRHGACPMQLCLAAAHGGQGNTSLLAETALRHLCMLNCSRALLRCNHACFSLSGNRRICRKSCTSPQRMLLPCKMRLSG